MPEKPLSERLQVKAGRRLAVVDAPAGLSQAWAGPLPHGTVGDAEVVLLFIRDRAHFDMKMAYVLPVLRPDAILWVAYPKLTSTFAVDLSRDVIRNVAPAYGLDTVSQIAVDENWSALRLKRVKL